MELRDVVHEYWAARTKVFTKQMILASWHKSGICPFNPNIFTDTDFAPSIVSSTKNQLPTSFPRQLPCAPDASSDDVFDPVELERMEEGERAQSGSESGSESEIEIEGAIAIDLVHKSLIMVRPLEFTSAHTCKRALVYNFAPTMSIP